MEERLSQSEENYLKAIYSLTLGSDEAISTNTLAEKLDAKASSITDMLRKLSAKNYLEYQKYQGCRLTESGRKAALTVVRKHRLWEAFLVDKLQFGWEEVHDIAEQLEHIHSAKLTDKLEEFLGFPAFDPHGDPIPSADGELKSTVNRIPLSVCDIGSNAVIMGVEDGSSEFLTYLRKVAVSIGAEIKVLDKFPFDGSLVIEVGGNSIQFSKVISDKIFVQKR